jgi:dimeric dUTPase (all-alpha-NTP-PPase superfamily)
MCIPEYTFLNKSKLSCVKKANLGKNYTADINDNTLYRKCSECIENCETCESYNKCITCKDGFVLTFDYKCVNNTEQTYYKDPSDTQYYPCNKAIDNCEKCSSNNTCNKCIDGYVKLNNKIEHANREIESRDFRTRTWHNRNVQVY